MTNFSHLKQSAIGAVVAASLIAGYTAPVFAHGYKQCCAMVSDFCGSDQACLSHGWAKCYAHQHPDGGNPPDPPDPVLSADPGHQPSKGGKFKKR
jgi:hypothetical protein